MTKDKVVLFRKFPLEEEAEEFVELLRSQGIPSKLVNNSPGVDITFTNATPGQNQYEVFVKSSDFQQAEQALLALAEKQAETIPSGHYLLEFSDEELIQLLEEKDKWNELDQVIARNILKERGSLPDDAYFARKAQIRLQELSKPEKFPLGLVAWGYLSALGAVISILPSPFAILVSCYILMEKKVLPNGKKTFFHSPTARMHGKIILGLSILMTITGLVLFFFFQKRFKGSILFYF